MMMKQRTYIHTVGVIFLLIAVLHALRLVFRFDAVIGNAVIPLWLSGVALVIAGYLAYQSFKMETH
jgi:uncharacterized membrane protein